MSFPKFHTFNQKSRQSAAMPRSTPNIIFITGTDTGVGKTVLSALLLRHLQVRGVDVLGMKPFCSGSTSDVDTLYRIMNGKLAKRVINPFYFPEPVAPLTSARLHRRKVTLAAVKRKIEAVANRCECLVVEGAGGIFVPLGEHFSVADLVLEVASRIIVVSRNRLGTINHTVLTVRALQQMYRDHGRNLPDLKVALMHPPRADASTDSNGNILCELLDPCPVENVVFLGRNPLSLQAIDQNQKKYSKTLARLLE